MKINKLNAVQVWKQTEDLLIPQVPLDLVERAVYYHLLRHTRLEGKPGLRFSIFWLAGSAHVSAFVARKALRTLIAKGVLRLHKRTHSGHVVGVRLPSEIHAIAIAERRSTKPDLEELDFLERKPLREAIHRREAGHCFYCSRRLTPTTRCLDHVVPRVHSGGNSYHNLVSSCRECNSLKADRHADSFLPGSSAKAASTPPSSARASAPSKPSPPAASALSSSREL